MGTSLAVLLALGSFRPTVQNSLPRRLQEEPPAPERPTEPVTPPDEWVLELFPNEGLYRPYLADPRQSHSGSKVQFPLRSSKNADIKIENTLGGFRTLALWKDPRRPDRAMDLSLEASVFSRFNIIEEWDLDAADYRFGFPFVYREGNLALKVHLWHLTSHLGDEYISREGRPRDSYHLDELALGASIDLDPHSRAYIEAGAALYHGSDTGSGRVQGGVEWTGRPFESAGRLAPFVAADLQGRRETDWTPNLTVTGGVLLRPAEGRGSRLRGFLEYYRGADQQTQFKSEREHYWAFGFAADL